MVTRWPLFLLLLVLGHPYAMGQEGERSGIWSLKRAGEGRSLLLTTELMVQPCAQSRPALKHLLIDDSQLIEGNAATHYLKAMGFLEQDHARLAILQLEQEARTKADAEGKEVNDFPPFSFEKLGPRELPLAEVRKRLDWSSFQIPMLEEAAKRRHFSLDRNIRDAENLSAYLIPEIQRMRTLAREQSMRCRLAMAEGRTSDAMKILGQQLQMARHLGQDDVPASNLVGKSVVGMATEDLLYFLQQSDAPNLYWALATLPSPLVDLRRGVIEEREMLFHQFTVLRDVDDAPWSQAFCDSVRDKAMKDFAHMKGVRSSQETAAPMGFEIAFFVASAYPGAKRYLIDEIKMEASLVKSYLPLQTVLLAMRRFYEIHRDEVAKYQMANLTMGGFESDLDNVRKELHEAAEKLGFASKIPLLCIEPIFSSADFQPQLGLSMVQTIEAIRHQVAMDKGTLPGSLEELALRAPLDPISRKPLAYAVENGAAVLRGTYRRDILLEVRIRFAK